jgi:ABC-type polysaccharide/polyol phosphate export permease
MGYRHKDTGPRLALWMLVAFLDVVLLLVSAGLSAPVAVLTVVALVVAGVAAWRLARRTTLAGRAAVPVPVATRRRA